MKNQLISGNYDYDDNTITLFSRDENNKRRETKIIGFEPYFFVPEGENIDSKKIISRSKAEIKSIYGDKLDKIVTNKPKSVGEIREDFSKHFEADIPFVRRFLVDSGITSGFEVPDNKEMVYWNKIKPVDFQLAPRFVLSDIEVFSEYKFPKPEHKDEIVTINCLYDSYTKKYLTIAVSPKISKKKVENYSKEHKVILVPKERDLLELTKQYLEATQPDIFSAWYVDFDKTYIEERAKRKKIYYPWDKMNVFDMLKAYRRLYSKGSNKLSDVVVNEELNVPNYEVFQQEYWKKDLKRAILVNKSHVESIVRLNEKLHLLDFYWELKNLAGFEDMDPTIYHGMLVENMLLRRYHDKYVLPSKPSGEEKKRRKRESEQKIGGKVLEPPFGIFENVGVFDMSRYYPEMLISQNLSPEPHKNDELGIVPKLTLELIEKRLEYDRKLNKLTPGTPAWDLLKSRRNSVKYVTESVIGYFGSEQSRVFDLNVFNSITTMGQRGLVFIQNLMNGEGHEVLYGDTDGLSITMPNVTVAIEKVNYLNESLKEFCRQEKINRDLTLKLDRYFSKILFKKKRERVDGKWVERGAKKRYAGRVIWEDGHEVDYLKIVGFEYVRRDSSKVTKRIQPTVFDLMLLKEPEDVKNYLKEEITKIRKGLESGDIGPDDIAIPVTLSKNPDRYDKPTDYVRGAKYCNKWFGTDIRGGDQVKMVYIKKIPGYPKTDVISYLSLSELPVEFEIDIDKMIDRNIRMKLEDVIDLIDLKWIDIFSTQKSVFEALGG